MSNLPAKILVIDADYSVMGPVSTQLEKMKVEVFTAVDWQTAVYRFNKQFFKVVLAEMKFPELDALSIIQRWRRHEIAEKRTAGFIVMTSNPMTPEQAALTHEMGSIQVIQKPLSIGPLISHIQRAYKENISKDLVVKIKSDIKKQLEKNMDFTAAIKSVNDFKEPLGNEYYTLLTELFKVSGNIEGGLDFLMKIPDNKIEPLQKLNMLGEFNLKLGNLKAARKYYEDADRIAPQNMERITQMVDMYMQMDDPDEAVERQKDLLDFHPENPDIKFDLFKQLEENGYQDHATEFCREISTPKEVVKYFNNKGVVMAQTDSLEAAISEYERALNYYPDKNVNYLIHFNLALAYLKKKSPKDVPLAKQHLESCLKLNPDFEKGKNLLSKIEVSRAG